MSGAPPLLDLTTDGYDSNDSDKDKGAGSSFLMDVDAVDFRGEGAGLHGSIMIRQAEFVALAVLAITVTGVGVLVVVVVVVVVVVSFCCFFPDLAEKSYHGGDMGGGGVWGPTHARTHRIPRTRGSKRAVYDG